MTKEVKDLSQQISESVVSYRRHLHAHPELSFKEFNTSAFIREKLDLWGIQWKAAAGTGVIALITGDIVSDNCIALRADMDALPIVETNQFDFISKNKGIMHACGHDAHTASLLGTAYILQQLKSTIAGTIKLIFQPGEEVLPGGAGMMIEDGVLKDPVPSIIIGQHVAPFVPAGKVGIRKGKFMASMDEIFIKISGRGGHAAQPHRNLDPVMMAAQMLVSLQQVVSRMADPAMPSVLSFGKLIANGAINIIPDSVYIEGTFRTMNEEWRDEAHKQIKKIAVSIVEGLGGICKIDINKGYPNLINEEATTASVERYAKEYLGNENVIEPSLWMAAEDFARYSQVIPSCFYLLGTGNEQKNTCISLHSPGFNIDEDALTLSTGLMAHIAIRSLHNSVSQNLSV